MDLCRRFSPYFILLSGQGGRVTGKERRKEGDVAGAEDHVGFIADGGARKQVSWAEEAESRVEMVACCDYKDPDFSFFLQRRAHTTNFSICRSEQKRVRRRREVRSYLINWAGSGAIAKLTRVTPVLLLVSRAQSR
jgi:hypothetical protein